MTRIIPDTKAIRVATLTRGHAVAWPALNAAMRASKDGRVEVTDFAREYAEGFLCLNDHGRNLLRRRARNAIKRYEALQLILPQDYGVKRKRAKRRRMAQLWPQAQGMETADATPAAEARPDVFA